MAASVGWQRPQLCLLIDEILIGISFSRVLQYVWFAPHKSLSNLHSQQAASNLMACLNRWLRGVASHVGAKTVWRSHWRPHTLHAP